MLGRKLTNHQAFVGGAAFELDGGVNTAITLTLDQSATLTPSNLVPGDVYFIVARQDGTGGWTLTAGATVLPLDPSPGAVTVIAVVATNFSSFAIAGVSASTGQETFNFLGQTGSPVTLAQGSKTINQCDGTALVGNLPPITAANDGIPVYVAAGSNGMTVIPDGDTIQGQTSLYIPSSAFAILYPYFSNGEWYAEVSSPQATIAADAALAGDLQFDTEHLISPAGAAARTLPNPALGKGRYVGLTVVTAQIVTVGPFAAETVNGAASYATPGTAYYSVHFLSDGVNWIANPPL